MNDWQLITSTKKSDRQSLTKSVVLVDHGKWCGKPHHWIRDFFEAWGYKLIETPAPPWMNSEWVVPTQRACEKPPGYDLRRMMRATVLRQVGAFGRPHTIEEMSSRLMPEVVKYWDALRSIILEHRPRYAVVFGDYRVEAQLTWLLCRSLGIRVLALEGCFLRDRFIIEELTGRCGNRNSYTWMWNAWKDSCLSAGERERLYSAVGSDNVGLSHDGKIRQPDPISGVSARAQLNIPSDCHVALVIGQVAYDSVIAEDLMAFDGSLAFYAATVEAFSNLHDWYVVVRCHPKEANEASGDATAKALRQTRFSHDRVRIVSGEEMNTYSLMDLARFGVTINSQAGLEMLLKGKPMLLSGKSFYGGQGFTLDLGHPCQLDASIAQLADGGEGTMNQPLLESFCYHYVFDYLVERTPHAVRERLARFCTSPGVKRTLNDYCVALRRRLRPAVI